MLVTALQLVLRCGSTVLTSVSQTAKSMVEVKQPTFTAFSHGCTRQSRQKEYSTPSIVSFPFARRAHPTFEICHFSYLPPARVANGNCRHGERGRSTPPWRPSTPILVITTTNGQVLLQELRARGATLQPSARATIAGCPFTPSTYKRTRQKRLYERATRYTGKCYGSPIVRFRCMRTGEPTPGLRLRGERERHRHQSKSYHYPASTLVRPEAIRACPRAGADGSERDGRGSVAVGYYRCLEQLQMLSARVGVVRLGRAQQREARQGWRRTGGARRELQGVFCSWRGGRSLLCQVPNCVDG